MKSLLTSARCVTSGKTDVMEPRFHYLDTNVLIAIIEPVVPLTNAQSLFLERIDRGEFFALTSELALSECLVKPFADGDQRVIDAYHSLFESHTGLAVMSVSRDILVNAARLRARHRTSLPDAIHISTAELARCEVFVTDDRRIRTPAGLPARSWNGIERG